LEQEKKISALIQACKKNNRKAQMQLYQLYAKAMYNTALRITGNPVDAEDIMQEAFIKAFSKLDSYQATASFGAWLKRIVINESISWIRKRKNNLCIDDNIQIADTETEPEIDEDNTRVEQVLSLMQKLKENYKIILTLYYIEGYDYEEIMEILNLSYANVRTMMSRAKKALKRKLEQEISNHKL
jgi:RNA polymerase sigma-70 factor (ECF subfamily)